MATHNVKAMKNTALRKIVREKLDSHPLYGVILNESNDYLLIAREYDFYIDGFQVLRKQDIMGLYIIFM